MELGGKKSERVIGCVGYTNTKKKDRTKGRSSDRQMDIKSDSYESFQVFSSE
jgi:hypothetical protein